MGCVFRLLSRGQQREEKFLESILCDYLFGTKLNKALNLYLSFLGLSTDTDLSQVCTSSVFVSFLTYFVVKTEPKVLCLV